MSENSNSWNSWLIQTADIDASDTRNWNPDSTGVYAGWNPIGFYQSPDINSFNGNYDGQNHTITGLYINRSDTDYVGLFGKASGANFANIYLIEADVYGGEHTGILAGYCGVAISNCHSSGVVTGRCWVGGIVGSGISITNCSSSANVSGSDWVGGLVGYSTPGEIRSSFSTGAISGNDKVGGLIGFCEGYEITDSYSECTVTGHNYVGGLVGYGELSTSAQYGVIIRRCHSTGSIPGVASIGGILGFAYDFYLNSCYSECTVSGTSATGGLAGSLQFGDIVNSSVNSQITGGDYTGGLAGSLVPGDIVDSYSSGVVIGQANTGGIVGLTRGCFYVEDAFDELYHEIVDHVRCASSFTVSGTSYVGGIVGRSSDFRIASCSMTGSVQATGLAAGGIAGYLSAEWEEHGFVSDCYNISQVCGNDQVGGVVGNCSVGHLLQFSYNTGIVTGTGNNVGGVIGLCSGDEHNCFWNTETSGQATSAGGTGLTTAQMQDINTYLNAGWDFVNETLNGSNDIWTIDSAVNNGYPTLRPGAPAVAAHDETNQQTPALSYSLSNYPNPFNPSTTIKFNMPQSGKVELAVYNVRGQKVRTLINDTRPQGVQSVVFFRSRRCRPNPGQRGVFVSRNRLREKRDKEDADG